MTMLTSLDEDAGVSLDVVDHIFLKGVYIGRELGAEGDFEHDGKPVALRIGAHREAPDAKRIVEFIDAMNDHLREGRLGDGTPCPLRVSGRTTTSRTRADGAARRQSCA